MRVFFLIAGAFFIMEFWAWFSHKYFMHGFLWSVHRDHHIKTGVKKSFFEKNDLFIFFFALPAMIMIIAGFGTATFDLVYIGAGFTLYGVTYFLLHDVLIHKRIKHNLKVSKGYLGALVRAHWAHHAPKDPTDFRNFGLLIFPVRFFKL